MSFSRDNKNQNSHRLESKPRKGVPIKRIRAQTVLDGDCWRWTGAVSTGGYGVMWINRRKTEVHRAQYAMFNGPLNGLCVLHTCDNRWCINPSHLFLGTNVDNAADMKKKNRAARPMGRLNGRSKITEQDVLDIRRLAAEMKTKVCSYAKLGGQFGISSSTAWAIARGKLWSHVKSAP